MSQLTFYIIGYGLFAASLALLVLAYYLRKKENNDVQVTKISTQELVKHINKEV